MLYGGRVAVFATTAIAVVLDAADDAATNVPAAAIHADSAAAAVAVAVVAIVVVVVVVVVVAFKGWHADILSCVTFTIVVDVADVADDVAVPVAVDAAGERNLFILTALDASDVLREGTRDHENITTDQSRISRLRGGRGESRRGG